MQEVGAFISKAVAKRGLFKRGSFILVLVLFALWCLAIALIFSLTLKWPYVGGEFTADVPGQTMVITKIKKGSPADKAGLKSGDRITAFIDPVSGERYKLTGLEAIAGRHQLHSYEMTARARESMLQTWSFISKDQVIFETANDGKFELTPQKMRALWDLPFKVFTSMAQSLLVLLIASGIFIFAKRSTAVNLLAISGLGLTVNSLTNVLIGSRETVIPPHVLNVTTLTNAFASTLFIYGLLALLWHFPSRINKFPFAKFVIGVGLFIVFVHYFALFDFPFHTYQFPNLLPFPIAIGISIIQWRRTRNNPLERASVMWFMLTIYGVTTLVMLFYSLPIILHYPPILSPHLATFALSFIYIGIALGTLRYRLFDIHRIWWRSIVWLAGGFIVFLADILLISQFDLEQSKAIPLALFIAGWAYFPIRQIILDYFLGSKNTKIGDHVTDMISTFSTLEDSDEFEGRFVGFMRRVFDSADFGPVSRDSQKQTALENNGLMLRIPNLFAQGSFQLAGKSAGRQLFSPNDVRVADNLTTLVRNIGDARKHEFEELKKDRERIVRDLHDDVGGKLLSLIYRTKDKEVADDARATLAALKESLIVVENTQTIDFDIAWHRIAEKAEQRLSNAKIKYEIQSQIIVDRNLSTREYINLKRIVQEIISNAIKYAKPGLVHLNGGVSSTGIILISCNNVSGGESMNEFSSKRGLANIRKRSEEIGATVEIKTPKEGKGISRFEITLTLPFPE